MNPLIGFAVNNIILPQPLSVLAPQQISNKLPAYSQLILVYSFLDAYTAEVLLAFRTPGVGLLSLQVPNGLWINNITTGFSSTGEMAGPVLGGSLVGGVVPGLTAPQFATYQVNLFLSCVPQTDVSLVVPIAPAMFY